MLTRREAVIEEPFRARRYRDHRRKVRGALPRIDAGPPREYPHLVLKLKKLRLELDRQGKICQDNIKLVHRMAIIMRTKRLDNINMAPRGPFEPRPRTSTRRSAVTGVPVEEDRWAQGGSFLEQVTSEVERHLKPSPPGKLIQHRAPAGLCRVPRVGPPPSPRTPARRSHLVPTITLPLTSPRSRRSPSPTTASERSSARCRRGRETTRLLPMTGTARRPSITASLPSPHDDNSSSAADEGDFEENEESEHAEDSQEADEQTENTEEENEEADDKTDEENESSSKDDYHNNSESEGKTGSVKEETDSDDRVSAILLHHHPNITIDEPSDDEFYT
ncbi:uncharacterized protein [Procambarus clarkii]|uniref:uncharacterized protein n=1 Tax=Procambarus clarkii TaxID=6728 RepID=UPI001E6756E1|nr:uncharacterized protein LOC123750733 [Procambarus clarkii]XP_045588791.1 uncharacterized protein LOC123750733 [Procambarus clarkii]